ncbi:serine/threonine protein kinase, putative [Ixodes scapularis]|uniref:Serine/threonine protein kinase, putative n=1 Tax=Ixodes scapularis TaxID=6945 RepID=B7Q6W5_IXOSC|nr:serine/threonine protein kinase, putative [Ixodes scapularis]|eukprot:XP_002403438.1 serine/threonine protein kinase, putative [Ixodes scapularis]
MAYRGVVWVFANISGMITVLPDGCIHSCNTNFSLMLFGYSQSQLQGKHITVVIPSFYDDFEYLDTDSVPLPPLDDDEEDSRACAFLDDRPESECSELPSKTGKDQHFESKPPPKCRPLNPLGKSFSARCSTGRGGGHASMLEDAVTSGLQDLSLTGSVTSVRQRSSTAPFQRSTSAAEPLAPLVGPSGEGGETSGAAGTSGDINGNVGLKVSTSADQLDSCPLRGGGDLYSGDSSTLKTETQHRGAHHASREDSSCTSSARLLRGLVEEEEDEDDLEDPDHNAAPNESAESTESEYTGGIYSDHYTTLQQIGKGAYGCVKMAYRKTDRLLVLQGNPYAGPELEMWALGVTLYTLIFGENPFLDVEETISACLRPPYETSEELWGLVSWLLHRDPQKRCTLPEAERHPWTTQPVCPESYRFEDVVHATPEEICPSKYFQQDGSIYFSCSLYDIGKGAAAARTPSCGSSASRSSHTRVQSHGLATANPDEAADPDGAAAAGASGPIYESTDILEGLESCS